MPNREIGGLSGFTQWLRPESSWLVAINRDDAKTRRRFSLAHEFKHILDNPYINVLYAAGDNKDKRKEEMCDFFAAFLLMPRPWVKRPWASGIQDTEVPATRTRPLPRNAPGGGSYVLRGKQVVWHPVTRVRGADRRI